MSTIVNIASAWRIPLMNCLEKKYPKPLLSSTPMMGQALELPFLLHHIQSISKLRHPKNPWNRICICFRFLLKPLHILFCPNYFDLMFLYLLFFFCFFDLEECYGEYLKHALQNSVYRWIEYVKSRLGNSQYFSALACNSICSFLIMVTNSFGKNNTMTNSNIPLAYSVCRCFLRSGLFNIQSFWIVLAYES